MPDKDKNKKKKSGKPNQKPVPKSALASPAPQKPVSRIAPVPIIDEMKSSYIDYAMSVIVGRALPDVRDGLKPVHRRILYAMNERGWTRENPYVKSAKIVGEVIGNFHPHGDMAVYDSMVRMAQNFAMRAILIDGQGNFGSVDGDSPAAYRYTEARLTRYSTALLKDIKKDTVDFLPNFDDSRKEPMLLPAAVPNLLVNGGNGIAVGMATNIPPHNLGEVIDATVHYIDNPKCTIPDLLQFVKGPDFPTGGVAYGYEGIRNAYMTGRGKVIIRAKADIEQRKGKDVIVIDEIPYQVNKSTLIQSIAELVRGKKVEGVSHLRDESDRKGLRITIELRNNAQTQVILNQLYKHTQMQITFGIIMLALVDNQPKVMNLKQVIEEYTKHRKEVVVRRTKFDLKRAKDRAHILEGLIKAVDMIDAIVKTIRASKDVDIARANLMKKFKFTEVQANAILEMRLQKLTGLERAKLIEEFEGLKKLIKELNAILASEKKVFEVIKKELLEAKEKFATERKTEIQKEITEFTTKDIIADEDMLISLSNDGFIKSIPAKSYRKQKRGGKGVTGTTLKGDDKFIRHLIVANTHDNMLFFTNKGKVFWMKVHEIPIASKQAKGRSLKVLLNLSGEERITALYNLRKFSADRSIVFITKKGTIKKGSSVDLQNAKRRGIIAINLDKEDELIDAVVFKEEKDKDVFIGTARGRALRMNAKQIRTMGRASRGVRGLRVGSDDQLVGIIKIEEGKKIMVITENGFGKMMTPNLFQTKGRGGKGMAYLKVTERNGKAVGIKSVENSAEIILTTTKGMVLKMIAADISTIGRATAGVRIVKTDAGDKVADITVVHKD